MASSTPAHLAFLEICHKAGICRELRVALKSDAKWIAKIDCEN